MGGCKVAVSDPWSSEQVDSLLQCARFLDWTAPGSTTTSRWRTAHSCVAASWSTSLAAVAFDVPLLLALFLLMSIRDDLVRLPVDPQRLNSKRLGVSASRRCLSIWRSAHRCSPRRPRGAPRVPGRCAAGHASITCAVISSGASIRSTGARRIGADMYGWEVRAQSHRRTARTGFKLLEQERAPDDRGSGGLSVRRVSAAQDELVVAVNSGASRQYVDIDQRRADARVIEAGQASRRCSSCPSGCWKEKQRPPAKISMRVGGRLARTRCRASTAPPTLPRSESKRRARSPVGGGPRGRGGTLSRSASATSCAVDGAREALVVKGFEQDSR